MSGCYPKNWFTRIQSDDAKIEIKIEISLFVAVVMHINQLKTNMPFNVRFFKPHKKVSH